MVDNVQLRELERVANELKVDGAVSGPALAASTVASVNTTGKTLLGRISAGTVTVFAIDGVVIGGMTTGEWFWLRPGSSYTVTYSVAPTLQWFEA